MDQENSAGQIRQPAAPPCRRAATAPRSPKAAAPNRGGWVWPEVAQVAPAAGDGVLPPCLDDKMGENGEPGPRRSG